MTFTAADGFIAWFSRNKVQVISDLSALINVDTSGRRNVSWRPYIMERFTEIGFVSEVVKSPTDLADHPLYVAPSLFRTAAPTLPETVRFTNLPNPRDGLRSVLFNVHIDVVPAA